MPIKHAIWTIGEKPGALSTTRLVSEKKLEEMILADSSILSEDWMLIGHQEVTPFAGRIDLLAIAPDASLVLIELKKGRTPREIVAQALDYASWVESLSPDEIVKIYQRFSEGGNLDAAFKARFGTTFNEEELNQAHQIILVAAELDDSTERIIRYLDKRDVAINVAFFQVFQNGSQQLLSRAWFIDPGETQVNATLTAKGSETKQPWNGEYYVSFGDGPSRSWEDAREYGFVSAGGGEWYTRTLKLLKPNERIWVRIPGIGFVGVGRVIGPAQPSSTFTIGTIDGVEKSALSVLQRGTYHRTENPDSTAVEWFVPIVWLHTVPIQNAVNETGLFGNQNTVCQPTTPKWPHTVERLRTCFKFRE